MPYLLTDRSGQLSWFSDQSEKHRIGRGRDLATCHLHWIPFRCFREEVENVSANQRPGGHLVFFFWSVRKHKPGSGRWDIASSQVSLNYVQWFQRGSRKCLSQSDAGAAILFSRSAQNKTHKLHRGHWESTSCQIRWIVFTGFRGEKLTTTDGRRTTRDHNSSQVFCLGALKRNNSNI